MRCSIIRSPPARAAPPSGCNQRNRESGPPRPYRSRRKTCSALLTRPTSTSTPAVTPISTASAVTSAPNVFFIITYVTAEVNGQLTSYWEPIAAMYGSEFTPAITDTQTAAFRLTEGQGGSDTVTVLWVDDNQISHQDGTITWTQQNGGSTASFAFTGQSSTFNPNVGTLTADNLYAIPGDLGSGNMLILDSTSKLYWISDYYAASPSMTALTGGTNQPGSAAAVGVGIAGTDTPLVTIFAIEPGNNYLWYLQQTSTTALTFGNWVQLGGTLYALNCPPSQTAVPELFSVGPGNGALAAYHTGQNLSDAGDGTYIWATHKVSAPPAPTNTTPTNTATYSMEVQALDSGQNPVANSTVKVTADQAVTVIWDSYAYHIGPDTPLEVELDGSGQATVLFEAVDLKPAVITFNAYDTNNTATASRWCRGDIVEYIQSLDGPALTPLSDSVAPQLQSVSGQDLINAGLTGGDYSQTAPANTAAEAVNNCGGYMVQNDQDTSGQGAIDTSRITIPHWQFDFSHPEGPRFRILTDQEAKDFLASLPKPGDVQALGSFGSVFGDVAHFFKHEFDQLTKFTATLQGDVLHIVFNDLAPFAIATIKQAGAGLETIFSKIKQIADEIYTVIKDVIAFLKMLFDWDNILNTHNVIKECVTQTLTNINSSLTAAEGLVDDGFATLQAEVKKVFGDLESNFESIQGQSFNAFVDKTSGSQNTLAGTNSQNAQQQHASKCQYVYSRSKPSFSGPNAITLPSFFAGLGGSDPTSPITDAVNQYIYSGNPNDQDTQTFNNSAAKLQGFVTNMISDPSAFFDLIIVDLLTAAEDLVLFIIDGLEYVINAAFTIAASAIAALTESITRNHRYSNHHLDLEKHHYKGRRIYLARSHLLDLRGAHHDPL